jgi:putative hydroxymethylpyrimidine transport system substrate-binding protein
VVEVTLPLFFPPRGRPFGWQDPAQWDAFAAWMKDSRLLERPPDARAAYDNRLLPGFGL